MDEWTDICLRGECGGREGVSKWMTKVYFGHLPHSPAFWAVYRSEAGEQTSGLALKRTHVKSNPKSQCGIGCLFGFAPRSVILSLRKINLWSRCAEGHKNGREGKSEFRAATLFFHHP